ncbi:MAG: hypothetical protein Q4D81_07640 [Eubacteriales bacterium]|nr:hypothetical protein [Eubacteriales bacterium]
MAENDKIKNLEEGMLNVDDLADVAGGREHVAMICEAGLRSERNAGSARANFLTVTGANPVAADTSSSLKAAKTISLIDME